VAFLFYAYLSRGRRLRTGRPFSIRRDSMRKANKEIRDEDVIIDLLNTCHVGRLGTIGGDGYPMIKPLNFAYSDNRIYFHTAKEGEKIEDIKRDNRVCFEVDLPITYVKAKNQPCEAEYLYRSVIIRGRATFVEDDGERLFALTCLMNKYQPEGGYGDYLKEKLAITGVVRIDIEEMKGKEYLGKDRPRERT
jgi:nitroimidazol reductase NimA-like FMN-containing flavoprotein (pyridoxamine 5'-phosphate oxidase superfamily)